MREKDLPVMRLTILDISIELLRRGYRSVAAWAKINGFKPDVVRRVIKKHCGVVSKGLWGRVAINILEKLNHTLSLPPKEGICR